MSGFDKRQTIDIVGGTYLETCLEPFWQNVFGSGLRASLAVKGLDPNCHVVFHSIVDKYTKKHVDMHYGEVLESAIVELKDASAVVFSYQNELKPPTYYYEEIDYPKLSVKANKCILFGMIEGPAIVDADYVVYDPQSPNNPLPFSNTGSRANHLCVVLNEKEAQRLSGKKKDEEIKDSIFASEKCDCLIIKKGASGALVFDGPESLGEVVPIFKTPRVWTIGSGDVFTSAFAYYWMIAHKSPVDCAHFASLAVACYSNSRSLEGLGTMIEKASFDSHIPNDSGMVYLAGPFFTMAERSFVNECREALMNAGLSVFSPFHDVGIGGPDEVVPKDIDAIRNCKTVFAILDGMDSGTVFEVGYAVALGKKVIILAENETKSHLQMMYGTKCTIVSDFTTAIYTACWMTNE